MHPKTTKQSLGLSSTVKSLGKGYMRAIILALLAEQPRYGYEILHTLAEASDGWRPSPGTIYPILHDFYERGWITKKEVEREGRRRIIYRLGSKGRRHLEHDALEHARFVAMMRKILIKHGGPRFAGAPAFNVDRALQRLEHFDLMLDEVTLIPKDVTSDFEFQKKEAVKVLHRRLKLLENHAGSIATAIQSIKKEIQNLEKYTRTPESKLET